MDEGKQSKRRGGAPTGFLPTKTTPIKNSYTYAGTVAGGVAFV